MAKIIKGIDMDVFEEGAIDACRALERTPHGETLVVGMASFYAGHAVAKKLQMKIVVLPDEMLSSKYAWGVVTGENGVWWSPGVN